MTRARINYTDRVPAVASVPGFNPDIPVAGHYRTRLRSGGVAVAIRIWFGPPIEPWTGEEMDRAPRWNATANGEWIEVSEVWPRCADEPISAAEAEHLTSLQRWGAEHGHAALANPRKRLDPLSTPLQF
ncbi:hypothetical protein [Sphingomonas sp.]|uniref:hypothetical protein n=1 Tax=Sphingomonas sp. TaxID=28214 RepID=UPI0035A8F3CC